MAIKHEQIQSNERAWVYLSTWFAGLPLCLLVPRAGNQENYIKILLYLALTTAISSSLYFSAYVFAVLSHMREWQFQTIINKRAKAKKGTSEII